MDVRISALQCAKAFYLANPYDGTDSREIMSKLLHKYSCTCLSFIDIKWFVITCDIFSSNLKLVSSKLLSQATERRWDIKACAVEFCMLDEGWNSENKEFLTLGNAFPDNC